MPRKKFSILDSVSLLTIHTQSLEYIVKGLRALVYDPRQEYHNVKNI